MGANEPAAPARLLQVGGAGGVVGKKSLKLWKRLWEPKIATLVNIDEHARTLALVAVGYNRIGKVQTSGNTISGRDGGAHHEECPRCWTKLVDDDKPQNLMCFAAWFVYRPGPFVWVPITTIQRRHRSIV